MGVNNYCPESYTSLDAGLKGIPTKTLVAQELPRKMAGPSLTRHSKMADCYHLAPRELEEDMHMKVGGRVEIDPEKVRNLGRMEILVFLEIVPNPCEVVPLASQNCSGAAESD